MILVLCIAFATVNGYRLIPPRSLNTQSVHITSLWRCRMPTSLFCEAASKAESTESDTDDATDISSNTVPPNINATAIDPREQAIKDIEKKLQLEVETLENILKSERQLLSKTRDKLTESGKTGFFMVQAQVNEFLKRKDSEQKKKVDMNKRDFVEKMLPVVDSFRGAIGIAPPTSEREENMHKNFGSLLNGIMIAFEKYGFKEFIPAVGDALDPVKHQVQSLVVNESSNGKIVELIRPGMADKDDNILRRAVVIGGKKLEEESAAIGKSDASSGEGSADADCWCGGDDSDFSDDSEDKVPDYEDKPSDKDD